MSKPTEKELMEKHGLNHKDMTELSELINVLVRIDFDKVRSFLHDHETIRYMKDNTKDFAYDAVRNFTINAYEELAKFKDIVKPIIDTAQFEAGYKKSLQKDDEDINSP